MKNIDRTVADYAKLKEVQLEIVNDKPLVAVLEFDLIHYIICVLSIFVVFGFIEERKRGLWNVIYSTSNGRHILALNRAITLAIAVIVSTVVMYTLLFGLSFIIYGGLEDIFCSVQSIEKFKNFIFPLSQFSFLLLYISINIMTQLAIAFLFWFVMTLIQNRNIALGVTAIIFVAEFGFYKLLPIQSNFAVIKCLNVFYLLDPTEAIIKYYNLNVFSLLINLYRMIIISSITAILLFSVITIIISGNKYPQKTPSKLESLLHNVFSKISTLYWVIVEKLTITSIELYKIIIIQKGWIVLLTFVYVLSVSVNTNELYFSGADSIVNSFYENYSGLITDETRKYVSDLENEIMIINRELEKAHDDYINGNITYDEYIKFVLKSDAYDSKREALGTIQAHIDYATMNKANEIDAWLVNPNGYNELLNTAGFSRQQNYAMLSVFCIIIIISGLFSFEKRSLMNNTIMSTYNGRQYLFYKKIKCATILTVFIWFYTYAMEIVGVCTRYPLSNLDAPIKSLEFFSGINFNCTIGVFLAFLYLFRLLILLSVSYIVCYISSRTCYEYSIIISLILLIVPSLLYVLGIDIFLYLSVIVPITAINIIISSGCITFFLVCLIIVLLGLVSILLAKHKWCNESRCKNET